jgi:hypothetical protein
MTEIHSNDPRPVSGSEAEETLRLIANLPAPQELEQRVHSALKRAPSTGTVLPWPTPSEGRSSWFNRPFTRGAAAAAIVAVVAGGCWGVYTRVQPDQTPKTYAMPRSTAPGGFSSASAMRTPRTLNGPVVAQMPVKKDPAQKSALKPNRTSTANTQSVSK